VDRHPHAEGEGALALDGVVVADRVGAVGGDTEGGVELIEGAPGVGLDAVGGGLGSVGAGLGVLPREVGAGPVGLRGVDLNEDLRVWCGAATRPRRPRRSSWLTVTHP
jgi:hypothetical protein